MKSNIIKITFFIGAVFFVAIFCFMLVQRHEENKFNVIIEQVEKCRTAAEVNRLLGKRIRHTLLSPDREDLEYFGLKVGADCSMSNTAVDLYGVGGIPCRYIYIFFNPQSSNVIKVAHSYM
ncbi:MAG: hypothetical protein PHV28_01830 [Kiritimatiellae bacterium]|nr:hypothetical protein [Kiritimatiellia bacterium]